MDNSQKSLGRSRTKLKESPQTEQTYPTKEDKKQGSQDTLLATNGFQEYIGQDDKYYYELMLLD